jgi:hypothetical protein
MRLNQKTYPTFNFLERGDYINLPIDSMFKDILPREDVNAKTNVCWYADHDYEIDKDSIINAYPLSNIK